MNNAERVSPDTRISWERVAGVRGYFLTVGTQLGLRDLADRVYVGNNNFYDPPENLPENSLIYVKITLAFSGNRPVMACDVQRFNTGTPVPIPECSRLTSPFNGETDVPLLAPLEWESVANASAYQVTIGSSEASNDFLDATFETNSTPNLVFQPNSSYYVTIIPFNSSGDAVGCLEESFSTILGCGPFLDPNTGILVDHRPEIDFPDQIDICLNEAPITVTSSDTVVGFRWYKIDTNDTETLISEAAELILSEAGTYRYEAYNEIVQSGNTIECSNSKTFTVIASEIATINAVDITKQQNQNRVEVDVDGIGDYEYALHDAVGPYQDVNSFENLGDGIYTVFVRDKNGCGISQKEFSIIGFPKFFTPNADGQNDTWNLTGVTNMDLLNGISIFDRYGKLIRIIGPDEVGWDGNYNGAPLPASDYWFRAPLANGTEFKGHFSLKR